MEIVWAAGSNGFGVSGEGSPGDARERLVADASSINAPSPPQRTEGSTVVTGLDKSDSHDSAEILGQAKQIKANIIKQDEVIAVDDIKLDRRPAWNPHAIQKSPVDTVDDLIIDQKGSLTVNPNKAPTLPENTVNIGIESDAVHWSPLYLTIDQQSTIQDIISYTRTHNPGAAIPAQWKDLPLGCLPQPSSKGSLLDGGTGGIVLASTGIDKGDLTQVDSAGQGRDKSAQPQVVAEQFKKLDMQKLTDRIVVAVSGNEGSFDTVTTNDAGFGWSVGMRQWNQRVGELPAFVLAMYKDDPCKFVKDFGPFADKMINNVSDPSRATVNESFIRKADFNSLLGYKDRTKTQLNHMEDVENALNDFQDVQLASSRQLVQHGIKLAQKYGFKTELGWAEVCDIINQKGAGGAERTLKSVPAQLNEAERIKQLEKAAQRPHGQDRLASLQKQFSASKTAKL